MCWSMSASLFMAIAGFALAGYLWHKKESKLLWIPIAYFAIMEFLQFLTYFHLGSCTPANQMLTYLSYLHISFQPIVINAILLYFIPKNFRKKIIGWVFLIAFIATILMLVKIYPFDWAGNCTLGSALCGERLCSIPGEIHLAWEMPINGIGGLSAWAYTISVFLTPLLYGAWKVTTYNILAGPILAMAITNNPNEFPAIWCFLSVAYMFVVAVPKLRKILKQKKWYFWKYPK